MSVAVQIVSLFLKGVPRPLMCMHEQRKREVLPSLTFGSFLPPPPRTSSVRRVIAHSDLCRLASPLITFTFCSCHPSDRQPTKVPPVKHPSCLYIIPTTSKGLQGHFPYYLSVIFFVLPHLNCWSFVIADEGNFLQDIKFCIRYGDNWFLIKVNIEIIVL